MHQVKSCDVVQMGQNGNGQTKNNKNCLGHELNSLSAFNGKGSNGNGKLTKNDKSYTSLSDRSGSPTFSTNGGDL